MNCFYAILCFMELDTSTILALISQIHSAASGYLENTLKTRGLPDMTSSHGNILFRLSRSGRLTMGELARQVNRDKSTVTVLVRKLEQNGFVLRETSADDNRVTYISLSRKGREYTDLTASISRELIATCYQGFTDQERQQVFNLLRRIALNFQ